MTAIKGDAMFKPVSLGEFATSPPAGNSAYNFSSATILSIFSQQFHRGERQSRERLEGGLSPTQIYF
jgi:hypothetical protein